MTKISRSMLPRLLSWVPLMMILLVTEPWLPGNTFVKADQPVHCLRS